LTVQTAGNIEGEGAIAGIRRTPREGLTAPDRARRRYSLGTTRGGYRISTVRQPSRELIADVAESVIRWITAALEPRRLRHCWSASVCRPDSPPNLLIETLGC